MAYTRTWDPARPLGNQPARNADDEIRFLRVDVEDRFKDLLGIADFTLDPLKPTYFKPTDGTDTSSYAFDSAGTLTNKDFGLRSNNTIKWYVKADGTLEPGADDLYNIGGAAKRVHNIHAANSIWGSSVGSIGDTQFQFKTNSVIRWIVANTGDLVPQGDNLYNLGSNAARVKNIFGVSAYINAINGDIDGGAISINTLDASEIKLRPNNTDRWIVSSDGHLEPAVNNAVNIGSPSKGIKDFYASGSIYSINIGTLGVASFSLRTNAVIRWVVQAAGHFVPNDDLSYDIGTTALRPRDVFIGRHLEVDGQAYNKWHDVGNSGTAKTIDWNNGNVQKLTLTGNVTLTLSNPKQGAVYTLYLPQDATGNRTITWPASVKWGANGAPDLTATGSKIDVVSLLYDGTSYLGFIGGYGY